MYNTKTGVSDIKFIINLTKKLQRWKSYIQDLYDDERPTDNDSEGNNENLKIIKLTNA